MVATRPHQVVLPPEEDGSLSPWPLFCCFIPSSTTFLVPDHMGLAYHTLLPCLDRTIQYFIFLWMTDFRATCVCVQYWDVTSFDGERVDTVELSASVSESKATLARGSETLDCGRNLQVHRLDRNRRLPVPGATDDEARARRRVRIELELEKSGPRWKQSASALLSRSDFETSAEQLLPRNVSGGLCPCTLTVAVHISFKCELPLPLPSPYLPSLIHFVWQPLRSTCRSISGKHSRQTIPSGTS